jgi:hypothetical protein
MLVIGAAVLIIGVKWRRHVQGIEQLVRIATAAVAIFGVGLCALCGVMSTYRKWGLRLEGSRFVVFSPFYEAALPWDCIALFTIVELSPGQRLVGYRFVAGKEREGLSRAVSAVCRADCDGVLPSNYGLSAVELYCILDARRENSLKDREISHPGNKTPVH